MSHYKLLGVKSDATDDAIRSGYKAAVLKAHPDKGGSAQLFKRIQDAYDVLRDPRKRAVYDEKLRAIIAVKRFSKSSMRPTPLPDVRVPSPFSLLDGEMYVFETAPDRLHCKFRPGDTVVNTKEETGCIIGLASNGIYWKKDGDNHASLLFCPSGFGGDSGIKLLYRCNVGNTTARTPMTRTASPHFNSTLNSTTRSNDSAPTGPRFSTPHHPRTTVDETPRGTTGPRYADPTRASSTGRRSASRTRPSTTRPSGLASSGRFNSSSYFAAAYGPGHTGEDLGGAGTSTSTPVNTARSPATTATGTSTPTTAAQEERRATLLQRRLKQLEELMAKLVDLEEKKRAEIESAIDGYMVEFGKAVQLCIATKCHPRTVVPSTNLRPFLYIGALSPPPRFGGSHDSGAAASAPTNNNSTTNTTTAATSSKVPSTTPLRTTTPARGSATARRSTTSTTNTTTNTTTTARCATATGRPKSPALTRYTTPSTARPKVSSSSTSKLPTENTFTPSASSSTAGGNAGSARPATARAATARTSRSGRARSPTVAAQTIATARRTAPITSRLPTGSTGSTSTTNSNTNHDAATASNHSTPSNGARQRRSSAPRQPSATRTKVTSSSSKPSDHRTKKTSRTAPERRRSSSSNLSFCTLPTPTTGAGPLPSGGNSRSGSTATTNGGHVTTEAVGYTESHPYHTGFASSVASGAATMNNNAGTTTTSTSPSSLRMLYSTTAPIARSRLGTSTHRASGGTADTLAANTTPTPTTSATTTPVATAASATPPPSSLNMPSLPTPTLTAAVTPTASTKTVTITTPRSALAPPPAQAQATRTSSLKHTSSVAPTTIPPEIPATTTTTTTPTTTTPIVGTAARSALRTPPRDRDAPKEKEHKTVTVQSPRRLFHSPRGYRSKSAGAADDGVAVAAGPRRPVILTAAPAPTIHKQ